MEAAFRFHRQRESAIIGRRFPRRFNTSLMEPLSALTCGHQGRRRIGMSLNRVVLIGNLTRDPESRYTPQGVSVVNTGIAVNRFSKNESGDYDVDFFNIVAFRRTADYMAQYLKKGNRVAIEGRLQTRSWDDAATGQKRTSFEIIADNVQNLTSRQESEGSSADYGHGDPVAEAPPPARSAPAAAAPTNTRRASAPTPPAPSEIDDESDPFADD
jgi:single-strand DNA-binding protein